MLETSLVHQKAAWRVVHLVARTVVNWAARWVSLKDEQLAGNLVAMKADNWGEMKADQMVAQWVEQMAHNLVATRVEHLAAATVVTLAGQWEHRTADQMVGSLAAMSVAW